MEEEDGLRDILGDALAERVRTTRLFMVGCGGIGCELLKDLVLSGFRDIHIIDLDTIDVTNLNRQFLFRKEHVRQPKSLIAREAAMRLSPDASIVAHHGNVKDPKFGASFVREFDVVLNALDNLDARRHVNRVCLAAGVPLIESGTAGYLGQVQPIRGGITECYECQPKKTPTQYPYCTIHSTPSQPIHCIIWAKEALFPQLFGPEIQEEEVPGEVTAQARKQVLAPEVQQEGELERARGFGRHEFFKAFHENVWKLLQLEALWKTRSPPIALRYEELIANHTGESTVTGPSSSEVKTADEIVWSLAETARYFVESCDALLARKLAQGPFDWDKDDADSLNFVTAAANLRSHCYGLERLSKFEIKSKAGNIIPAIATTNAIIAGLMVMELFKILRQDWENLRFTALYHNPNPQGCLLVLQKLDEPSSSCLVCSSGCHYVTVELNVNTITLGEVMDDILRKEFAISNPTITLQHTSSILCESLGDDLDQDEKEWIQKQLPKTLASVGATHNSVLLCMDNDTQRSFLVTLSHVPVVEVGGKDEEKVHAKFRVLGGGGGGGGGPVAPDADVAVASPATKRSKVNE